MPLEPLPGKETREDVLTFSLVVVLQSLELRLPSGSYRTLPTGRYRSISWRIRGVNERNSGSDANSSSGTQRQPSDSLGSIRTELSSPLNRKAKRMS